jgi:CheY-like chemotaxis protein
MDQMTDQTTPLQPAEPPRKKILCIEDEHFINELYTRALTKAGYEVKVIIDGEEGLKEARTDAYDIILLDIMLPTMKGTEILKRLRSPKDTPNLRAKIIITTNLELGDADRGAIEAQADGYVVKAELTPRQLADFLQQLKA